MLESKELQEEIVKEYPRLKEKEALKFKCHKGLPCFTQCCGDVNIVLTPYDVIRMKNRLTLSSEEFLAKHTICPFTKEQRFPVIVLKMRDDEKKSCPFVSEEEGCGIYEDRPWSCRMYPLGLASPKDSDGSSPQDEEFYFMVKDSTCQGIGEESSWTVDEYLEDQGIPIYNEMGEDFKAVTLHDRLLRGKELEPSQVEMFYMVCYDLDKFRRFLFESTFFDRFEVDEETRGKIKTDDVALMHFGFQWLRYCLFGEKTITPKAVAVEDKSQTHP